MRFPLQTGRRCASNPEQPLRLVGWRLLLGLREFRAHFGFPVVLVLVERLLRVLLLQPTSADRPVGCNSDSS